MARCRDKEKSLYGTAERHGPAQAQPNGKGGHKCPLAKAKDAMERGQRKNQSQHNQRNVKGNLHPREAGMEDLAQGLDASLARIKDQVGMNLQGNAKGENHTAQDHLRHAQRIVLKRPKRAHPHPQVDEHPKDEDHRHLRKLQRRELPPQQRHLRRHKEKIDEEGRHPKGERWHTIVHHQRQRGNGRRAQLRARRQRHAKTRHRQTANQQCALPRHAYMMPHQSPFIPQPTLPEMATYFTTPRPKRNPNRQTQ